MPVTPATEEAEIGRIKFQRQPGENVTKRPPQIIQNGGTSL
jgi:hypothetical protein